MSLIDQIHIAQRNAGEDAVIRHLEEQGLAHIGTCAAEQPAQPQQEPVGEWGDGRSEAKRILWKPGYVVSAKVGDKLYASPQPAQQHGFIPSKNTDFLTGAGVPDTFTFGSKQPPAQRTWVGLTDAETEHFWEISRAAMPRYHTFKTLIEKALRERNT